MTEKRINRGYDAFVRSVYYIFGVFGFLAYFSYLVKLVFWPSNRLELISAFLGIFVAGVPVFFRPWLERKIPEKVFKILENIFAFGMLFYFISFMCLSFHIYGMGKERIRAHELSEDTVFVVFGAGLNGESPGLTLQKRLDITVRYMDELPMSVCIVSGGQGSDEAVSEALAMKNYLLRKGISADRIYIEDKSSNTLENIKFSKLIIEKEGLNEKGIVSVSNAFHIPRIELICSRLGVESRFILADDPNFLAMFPVLVREYMSYAKLFIFGTE